MVFLIKQNSSQKRGKMCLKKIYDKLHIFGILALANIFNTISIIFCYIYFFIKTFEITNVFGKVSLSIFVIIMVLDLIMRCYFCSGIFEGKWLEKYKCFVQLLFILKFLALYFISVILLSQLKFSKIALLQFDQIIFKITNITAQTFVEHGHYCGLNLFTVEENPMDMVDKCCKEHDKCWEEASNHFSSNCLIYIIPYDYKELNRSIICNNKDASSNKLCLCDKIAAECFKENIELAKKFMNQQDVKSANEYYDKNNKNFTFESFFVGVFKFLQNFPYLTLSIDLFLKFVALIYFIIIAIYSRCKNIAIFGNKNIIFGLNILFLENNLILIYIKSILWRHTTHSYIGSILISFLTVFTFLLWIVLLVLNIILICKYDKDKDKEGKDNKGDECQVQDNLVRANAMEMKVMDGHENTGGDRSNEGEKGNYAQSKTANKRMPETPIDEKLNFYQIIQMSIFFISLLYMFLIILFFTV